MQTLMTEAGSRLGGQPWTAYPRPQLRRKDWLCLNGEWSLEAEGLGVQAIRVPFCPESLLSGVKTPPDWGALLVYRRRFSLPAGWAGRRVLLHFGAVSREAEVLLNGRLLARHDNAYLPFTVELTGLLPGENELCVRVRNDLSHRHPWGKQRRDRGGMWYTPVSGIWQTVWLEPVPERYVRALSVTTGPDWAEIRAEGVESGSVELAGRCYPLAGGRARIPLDNPRLWSPEDPYLYSYALTSGEDRVESYFALRTLSIEKRQGIPRLCLNGRPYFFHGLLDQGYWSDGLYTPAAPESYAADILAMKELGFNTLRKHIKIEPEQFYYDCDRLGMVVFQDMVNCGEYDFLRDTALPTLGLQKRDDRGLHRDAETRKNFLSAMEETVRLLSGHPCICLWTIFNEGWGQFCADEAYDRLKALDPTRFVDATSGWFHQWRSDVDSLHLYFQKPHLGKQRQLPQFLSEYGGYSWKLPEHSFNLEKTYGYRKYTAREPFVRDLRGLLKQLVPLAEQGLCAAVYTQVSDVEDETNGLLSFDRKVRKVEPEELAGIAQALQRAVE